ncbi:hypothetical protein IV203_021438 [Nitzschia inconspicua]|uniref:Uncharacterized protein n=1 Tax=Nitzschia inconspicua TaxID=303405 RepID=A0A9K3KGX9_9STRA|nr:hypothetical protein IV203_021438 [Nitzschia inconspicua]
MSHQHHGTRLFVSVAAARALKSVCHQNKKGVSLYKKGRCVEAVHSLKEAMNTSKTFLKQCLEGVEGTTAVDLCISLQVLPSQIIQSPENHSFIDPSVYSKPFEMDMTLFNKGETSLEKQMIQGDVIAGEPCLLFSTLSSILIFNFALAHHALAISSREDNSTGRHNFFSQSRDLYGLAYKSLQGEQQLQEIIDPVLLHLLVQAILNNLSQCYASLCDTENSTKCSKLLLKSVLLFQQNHHHHRSRTHVMESQNDRTHSIDQSVALFLKNTLFLILKDSGFAPAA